MSIIREATVEIAAPPERVWGVLVDGNAYPEWDSGIDYLGGRIAAGKRLRLVHSAVAGKRPESQLKVAEFTPPQRMVWAASIPLLGKKVMTFDLLAEGPGTRFTFTEEHGGGLFSFIQKIGGDFQESVDGFAAGLKDRVEGLKAA